MAKLALGLSLYQSINSWGRTHISNIDFGSDRPERLQAVLIKRQRAGANFVQQGVCVIGQCVTTTLTPQS